jgi:hypothetical protein
MEILWPSIHLDSPTSISTMVKTHRRRWILQCGDPTAGTLGNPHVHTTVCNAEELNHGPHDHTRYIFGWPSYIMPLASATKDEHGWRNTCITKLRLSARSMPGLEP